MNRMGLIVDKGSLKKTVQVPFYCRWRSLLLLLLHSPLWNFCHRDKQDWIDWRAMKLHSLGSTQSLLSLTHTIVVTDTGSSGNQPSQQSIKEEEGSQDYWLLEASGEGKSLSFVYPLLNRAGADGSFKPVSHRWLWLTLMDHKTKWIHMSMREDLWGGGWGVGEEGSENGQNASQTWLFLKERSG